MKTVQFILISLVVGIVSATISHTALAQKDVKLAVHGAQTPGQLSCDISGNSVIIGAPIRDAPHDDHAKIYIGNGKKWQEQAKIIPRGAGNWFGWSVSISRNTVIVGAPKEDGVGDNSGSAYIFVRSGNDWKQQAKLVAEDEAAADNFGETVSIDRNTAIVGAPKDDDAGKDSGSAYIFVRDGLEINAPWKQQAKLVPHDLGGNDGFGHAVFVRRDTAIVGASGHTHSGVRFAGAAYVFVREGKTWVEQTKLTAGDAGKADRFGSSVAMSGDTIIVGSPSHDSEVKTDAGAAYVFVPDGNRWQQQAKLSAKDLGKVFKFGTSVTTTGNIAIVGAPGADDAGIGSGAAYSFVRVDGVWEERQKVVLDEARAGVHFGLSVAMSENTAVVASHAMAKCDDCGWNHGRGAAAYVYNTVEDFGTPPFAVEPSGLRVITLGQVKHTALFQNFPNPFNPETWLPYHLATDAPVTFRIYNVQGQLMRELHLGMQKAGGYLSRETAPYWDGRGQFGETVSSGVYFYTLQAGAFQDTRRMLIVK